MIIDNNIDLESWGAPELRRCVLGGGATVAVRRAPEGDLPESPQGFDRIIVSGSRTSAMAQAPWIDRLLEFTRQALDARKPFLGVCYGHQVLCRAVGGLEAVGRSDRAEVGWTRIELTRRDPLFKGLADEFYSFSSHFEEVKKLPAGLERLARSKDCEVQACRVSDKPAYGIQFHPEKNLESAELSFVKHRKEKTSPSFILEPRGGRRLYDAKVAETIFKNFLSEAP